jgi:hypothetical protein
MGSPTRVASVQPVDACIDDFALWTPSTSDVTDGFCDVVRVNTDLATLGVRTPGDTSLIVTNGTFATDTSWTKGAGWTIAASKATMAAASSDLSQAAVLKVGETYTIVFTTTGITGGDVTAYAGTTAGTARSTNNTFSQILTCAGNTTLKFTANACTGSVSDVQIYKHTPPLVANTWEPIRASKIVACSSGSVWIGWLKRAG